MKFADQSAVTSRFEGTIPSGRLAWVGIRIADVENALMGLVPELRKALDEIGDRADLRGDPGYLDRVKTLVCDKVLQLYRNPSGHTQRSVTVDDVAESWSASRLPGSATVTFSAEELAPLQIDGGRSNSVRLISRSTDTNRFPTC